METHADLQARLDIAIQAGQAAGDILKQGFRSGAIRVSTKSNSNDVVTEFDLRAEKTIVGVIRSHFPEDSILTEEQDHNPPTMSGQWVIDPLDGTNNFSQQLPHFAVSIAYCDRFTPLVACIHDPIREELFAAVRGCGTTLNGNTVRVSSHSNLSGAFLGVGTSIRPSLREDMHLQMPPFLQTARALRTTGSAALDLAYVAAGRLDAAWYPELHWWDIAAGILLVTEAGGHCSSYKGETPAGSISSIIASNGLLHEHIRCRVDGESHADG